MCIEILITILIKLNYSWVYFINVELSTLIIIYIFYNLNLTINAGLLSNKIKINLLVVERSYNKFRFKLTIYYIVFFEIYPDNYQYFTIIGGLTINP